VIGLGRAISNSSSGSGAPSARWYFVPLAALGAVAALLVGAVHAGSAMAAKNIVVVMTDDLDVRSMRVMKTTRRQIGHRGVRFVNSVVTTPICCPSRATFQTGLYAHNHRVVGNDPPNGGSSAFTNRIAARKTLAVRLHKVGYRTGYVGKYLNDPSSDGNFNVPKGWNQWFEPTAGTTYHMYNYILNANGHPQYYGGSPRDYQTRVLARKSANFISKSSRRRKPFFLMLGTVAPHDDGDREGHYQNPLAEPRYLHRFDDARLPTPPSFNERDVSDKPRALRRPRLSKGEKLAIRAEYRSRLESLLSVDDAVGRIIGRLRRTGELKHTVLIFTSDNGFLQGEHRETGKSEAYEESIRVPLLIRGPGLPRDERRTQVVANVDLAPTILDLAGAPRGGMDGRTLVPLIRHPDKGRHWERLIEMLRGSGQRPFRALRTRDYVIVKHPRERHPKLGPIGELYDLDKDPYQLVNRYRDPNYAGIRRRLSRHLKHMRNCSRRSCS